MDPNANLKEQLQIANRLLLEGEDEDDTYRLAELVLGLDGWIKNGGFLPISWKQPSEPKEKVR